MAFCFCGKEVGFRPDFNKQPLTEKFYARHDRLVFLDGEKESVQHYMERITERLKYDPRKRFMAPLTENQRYGWLIEKCFIYSSQTDRNIFYKNRTVDEELKLLRAIYLDMVTDRRRRIVH